MEKQTKIVFEREIKPVIKIIRNTYMAADSLIREEIIKKTWIIPTQRLS